MAGALLALWLRYTGPDTTLSFEIMLDILLIVVIGGMGSGRTRVDHPQTLPTGNGKRPGCGHRIVDLDR